MENFEININYQEWSKKPAVINSIAALFNCEDNTYLLLKAAIERENNEYGGSPEVQQISLENISYDAELQTGKFRVVYLIKFHFTCSDYRKEKDGQTSDWIFSVDLENGKLYFQGPAYLDLRSTADEF